MSSELKSFKVYLEPVTVKAKNQEEAEKIAQKFYQKEADLSYFQSEDADESNEPLIGPGFTYDIHVDEENN